MARTQVNAGNILDHTLTGASFNPALDYYDETSNYSSGDKKIWKNRLYTANTSITGATEGTLTNNPESSTDWDAVLKTSVRSYTSSSQTFSGTAVQLALDTVAMSHSNISFASNGATFNIDGIFWISMNTTFADNSSSRTTAYVFIETSTNGGTSWSTIPNAEIYSYIRTSSENNGRSTTTINIPINVVSGQQIRVMMNSTNGDSIKTLANACNLALYSADQ